MLTAESLVSEANSLERDITIEELRNYKAPGIYQIPA
jgi:hypothetical protein